jgi:hypothetical protein
MIKCTISRLHAFVIVIIIPHVAPFAIAFSFIRRLTKDQSIVFTGLTVNPHIFQFFIFWTSWCLKLFDYYFY